MSAYTVENVFDVPTVTDKLFDENTIPQRVVGISFEPSNTTQVTNGELTFGKLFLKVPTLVFKEIFRRN